MVGNSHVHYGFIHTDIATQVILSTEEGMNTKYVTKYVLRNMSQICHKIRPQNMSCTPGSNSHNNWQSDSEKLFYSYSKGFKNAKKWHRENTLHKIQFYFQAVLNKKCQILHCFSALNFLEDFSVLNYLVIATKNRRFGQHLFIIILCAVLTSKSTLKVEKWVFQKCIFIVSQNVTSQAPLKQV